MLRVLRGPHLRPAPAPDLAPPPPPDQLALGADINARDGQRHYHETALHVAAREKRIDLVEVLIAAGADQLATNNHGRTPYRVLPRKMRPLWPASAIRA